MKRGVWNRWNAYWIGLILLSYLLISVFVSTGIINNVYITVLMGIGINIILAVSLNLIIGITGQFSLGHAGFMCIGAYATGVMMKQFSSSLSGVFIGMVVGIIISAVVALLVAGPTLRLKGDYLAIATLGFGEIIRIVVLNLEITNGAAGLILQKVVDWPIIFVVTVISIVIVVNFGISAKGRACLAIREDEVAAEAMGINTTKYKIEAFVIGAVLASVAGSLYAGSFYVIKPDMFTFTKSIDILVIVVFGGMGSVTGSVIAATVIGFINIFLQRFAEIRMIAYGLALVCIMIFRPGGLLSTKEFTFTGLWNWIKERRAKS